LPLEKPGSGDLAADAANVAGRAARRDRFVTGTSFEAVYPKHEFSELVRLGLALARWIRGCRPFAIEPDVPAALPPGDVVAAD
jgi:hypothetical protein